jgi:predicted nucleic acid-binding protein
LSSLYLDASAITKLVLDEPETAALQALVRGRSLLTSRVAMVEVTKAVSRANPDADPGPVFALIAFLELDADLAHVAGATGGMALRSLDAIHVASALRAAAEVGAFVTYDTRQAAAAAASGLRVEAPGGQP